MYISENEENEQNELTSRAVVRKVKNALKDSHKATWIDKKAHGYVQRKVKERGDSDQGKSCE